MGRLRKKPGVVVTLIELPPNKTGLVAHAFHSDCTSGGEWNGRMRCGKIVDTPKAFEARLETVEAVASKIPNRGAAGPPMTLVMESPQQWSTSAGVKGKGKGKGAWRRPPAPPRVSFPRVQSSLSKIRSWEDSNSETLSLGWYVRSNDFAIDTLVSFANVSADSVVLDIGCGEGEVLRRLTQHCGCRGMGIEVNPLMYREAMAMTQKTNTIDVLDFRFMRAEDIDMEDVTIRSVTHVFLFVLRLDNNDRLLHMLKQFVDRGVVVITSTFELPKHQFKLTKIWPDEDTEEGLCCIMNPPYPRFYMY
jgi:ubiquinone/menaquinone biosynthesis C-methylase UbiE